jgi:hypothetical protein
MPSSPWLSDNRENKKLAREKVFSCDPKKSVLLLPGYRCECAKYGLSKGIITEDTVCLFVEREIETVCAIRQWVQDQWQLPIPPLIHYGELYDLEMIPIDLGYIDLFGNLTKTEIDWIQKQLIPNLMPGCDLAFTFSVPIRGNEFMKRALITMNTKHVDIFQNKLKNIKGIDPQAKQVAALYEILFERLFADHHYSIEFWTYRDKAPFTMLLVILKNITKNPELLRKKYGL